MGPGAVEHKNTLSLSRSRSMWLMPFRDTGSFVLAATAAVALFPHIQSVYVTNYKTVITKNFALNKFTTKTFGVRGEIRWGRGGTFLHQHHRRTAIQRTDSKANPDQD